MPANVGQMFYFKGSEGDVPWHGEGEALSEPADVEGALKSGGLEWSVSPIALITKEDPPSPVGGRVAFVRSDRPAGARDRVVGVGSRGFKPVQNRDAAMIFDDIFGRRRGVYHTGGYLGSGEVIWLLARLDRDLQVALKDTVQTYALLVNSHDGSRALTMCLTTVRVVCQNTINVALGSVDRKKTFRRGHFSAAAGHETAARSFYAEALQELDRIEKEFQWLASLPCSEEGAVRLVEGLLPVPTRPGGQGQATGLQKAWETRLERIKAMRQGILRLRTSGRGMDSAAANGTMWGMLNAVTEYIDHHDGGGRKRGPASLLLGDAMALKVRAHTMIVQQAGGNRS